MTRRGLRTRVGPAAVFGLFTLGALGVFAVTGPWLTRWEADEADLNAFAVAPSAEHWFGTTQTGMDVFALTVRGLRGSLVIGPLVAVASTGLATMVGAFAGYLGGWVDRVLMGSTELLLVLPPFLVLATVSPVLRDAGPLGLAVALAALLWVTGARAVRAMTVSLRERGYVTAARSMGGTAPRVVFRHIIPNLTPLLVTDATLNVGAAVLGEASLSYVGLGMSAPGGSLGTVIAEGAPSVTVFPWVFGFAATALAFLVLAVSLLGRALRDALDPAMACHHAELVVDAPWRPR